MLIEFSGIDGSGKSSAADALAGIAIAAGVACYQHRLKPPSRRTLSAISEPLGMSKHQLFGVDAVEAVSAYELLTMARTSLSDRLDFEIQIVEPYLQACLAIAHGHGHDNLRAVSAILQRAPQPELSFRLDLPIEAALERINNRPQGDIALIRSGSSRLEAYQRGLIAAEQQGLYPVVAVDSTKATAKEIAGMVWEKVQPMLRQRAK